MTAAAATAPRTLLFVPGDRVEEYLAKAQAADPDAIIIDLEDGVAVTRRAEARQALAAALHGPSGGPPVYVRINPASSPDHLADLEAAVASSAVGVVLPKVDAADAAVSVAARWADLSDRPVAILALLETARGLLRAAEIAGVPDVVGIALGAEDLAAQVGFRRTHGGSEILVARSLVALAATAAGCWAIDTPCLELDDLAVVQRDARRAAALGFDGKLVVHPGHVPVVSRAFAPTARQVAAARRTLAAVESMAADGRGVRASGGHMVDRPVLESARNVLHRAARAGRQEDRDVQG